MCNSRVLDSPGLMTLDSGQGHEVNHSRTRANEATIAQVSCNPHCLRFSSKFRKWGVNVAFSRFVTVFRTCYSSGELKPTLGTPAGSRARIWLSDLPTVSFRPARLKGLPENQGGNWRPAVGVPEIHPNGSGPLP